MNEEPQRKSHTLTWTLGVTLLPFLYLLILPWIEMGLWTSDKPEWAAHAFLAPWMWLRDHTLLGTPMDAYWNWCSDRLGGGMLPPVW